MINIRKMANKLKLKYNISDNKAIAMALRYNRIQNKRNRK